MKMVLEQANYRWVGSVFRIHKRRQGVLYVSMIRDLYGGNNIVLISCRKIGMAFFYCYPTRRIGPFTVSRMKQINQGLVFF